MHKSLYYFLFARRMVISAGLDEMKAEKERQAARGLAGPVVGPHLSDLKTLGGDTYSRFDHEKIDLISGDSDAQLGDPALPGPGRSAPALQQNV
ncbi:MAG: hypothetical protein WAU47_01150 [Desulfobaccales bacterium]